MYAWIANAGRKGGVRATVLASAMLLAACAPQFRNHGYTPSDEDLANIVVGVDTRETVADSVGTPSSGGVLRDTGYYYVSQRVRKFGYREPEIVDRQIVAISFDTNGVVSNVERFGLEDGNVIALSRRVTDSNIEGIGFLRQLAGNLGRVNTSALGGGAN